MTPLLTRLRNRFNCTADVDVMEAADEIERLTAELEATKKAVQQNYFRVVEVTAERDALAVDNSDMERGIKTRDPAFMYAMTCGLGQKREIEALAADAARYRWLRDESCGHPFWKQFDAGMTSNGMDSEIDAAIKVGTI